MSKLITVVINADTRIGYLNPTSTVGDFGGGSLQGVRSVDLLTEGVKNKMDFFKGYNTRCVLIIDKHEELPSALLQEIADLVYSYGNNSQLIIKTFDHESWKWNDKLYIESLKHTSGDYTCHMDMDCCAYRKPDSNIVEQYLKWLDEGYKYVCQSWDGIGDEMYWASTRFFICKTETLDFDKIEANLYINPLFGKNNPCLEHTISLIEGDGKTLYPKRDDEQYIIFCWASYFSGLMKHLNNLPYEEVIKYLKDCGLFGTHDIISKPVTND